MHHMMWSVMFILAVESNRNFLLPCAKITVCFRFLSRKQKWGGKRKKEGLEPDCFHQKFVDMGCTAFLSLADNLSSFWFSTRQTNSLFFLRKFSCLCFLGQSYSQILTG
jgi:hypothetical protein